MKVGLIGVKLEPQWQEVIQNIKRILEIHNCKVDMSYFSTNTDEDASDLENAYKRNKRLLKTNDFIIAETTQYSSGIGYLIADAIHNKKPVLALYNKKLGDKPSNVIKSSTKTKQLVFFEYDETNLEDGITKFLKKVKNMVDSKFILQLPPEIDQYLEWMSFQENIPKSQVVREAISNKMKRNSDWKQYQDEISNFEL